MKKTKLMARKGFKRLTLEQVKAKQELKKAKRKPLKGQKRPVQRSKRIKLVSVSSLEKKVWKLAKQVTRKNWCKEDGTAFCFTCEKHLTDKASMHTGHWRKKSILPMTHKYDLRMLKIQCPGCNLFQDGNEAEYTLRLMKKYGSDWVTDLDDEWRRSKLHLMGGADSRIFLQNLISQYTKLLDM